MSIASEFDSTIENIKSDYEGLENIGADLTNIDKNIYNIRTCLDNIYTNLPKTTGEGSNLSLTTLKGRINVDDILGDTKQDSTTGYNILNFNSNVVLEDNMLSTDKNAGRVLASDIQLKANTTYYFKFILLKKQVAQTTLTSYIDGTPDSTIGQSNIQSYSVGTLVTKQITPTSNCALSIAIWGNANAETIKFQYWITTDNTKNTFEPYTNGASPNPTYPQDINVVTGTQEVIVQNKNLFNNSADTSNLIKARCSVSYSNGQIVMNTTGADAYWGNITTTGTTYSSDKGQLIQVNSSTQYTFSITNTSIIKNFVVYYDENKTSLGYAQMNSASYTFTTPATCKYVSFRIGYNDSVSGGEYKFNIQLELGSTATSYIEHQEQTKTLHLGDIELAKIGTYQDRISKSSGKNLLDNSEVKQVLNDSGATRYGYYCEIPKTASYILKTPTQTSGVFYGYSNDLTQPTTAMGNLNSGLYKIANFTQGTYLVIWGLNANTPIDIMFAESSVDIPYEPYGSDKWYIEKNIGKVVLNGSENWQQASSVVSGTARYFYNNDDVYRDTNPNSTTIYVMSNKFKGMYWNAIYTIDTTSLNGVANYNNASGTGRIVIRMDDNSILPLTNNVANFKTWLASNGVEVYFVKATTTYEEITNENLVEELNELEKMMSYNGQTNISVSGNLPMILDVSALKGE